MDGVGVATRGMPVLAVGDPRRPPIGRAVVATVAVAGGFVGFAFVGKQLRSLYEHSPWQNDPYDAVVSFAIFFVPLVGGLIVLRAILCRRDAPLPLARVSGLLRACQVLLGAVVVTLLADWASVATRADEASWNSTTGLLVGLLGVATVATALATWLLRGAMRDIPAGDASRPGPDGLADALTLAGRVSWRLGPFQRPARAMVRWLDRSVAVAVRRHPIGAAALFAGIFGLAIAAGASTEEGIGPVLGLFVGVPACGMYAFTVAAGGYLGLVRAERPLRDTRRRLADATVVAAAAVPVALAFRSSLWWLIGTTDAIAGLEELDVLLVLVATVTFVGVLGVETLAGIHRGDPTGAPGA
jgi:hypothetical protein